MQGPLLVRDLDSPSVQDIWPGPIFLLTGFSKERNRGLCIPRAVLTVTRRWTVRACSGDLATPQPGRFTDGRTYATGLERPAESRVA